MAGSGAAVLGRQASLSMKSFFINLQVRVSWKVAGFCPNGGFRRTSPQTFKGKKKITELADDLLPPNSKQTAAHISNFYDVAEKSFTLCVASSDWRVIHS